MLWTVELCFLVGSDFVECFFVGSDFFELGSSLDPPLFSGDESGPGQFPTEIPKTLIHGNWNLGRDGRLGKSNSTPVTGGRFHTRMPPPWPPQPGQPTSTGTTVELPSWPVVVTQVFVVHSE